MKQVQLKKMLESIKYKPIHSFSITDMNNRFKLRSIDITIIFDDSDTRRFLEETFCALQTLLKLEYNAALIKYNEGIRGMKNYPEWCLVYADHPLVYKTRKSDHIGLVDALKTFNIVTEKATENRIMVEIKRGILSSEFLTPTAQWICIMTTSEFDEIITGYSKKLLSRCYDLWCQESGFSSPSSQYGSEYITKDFPEEYYQLFITGKIEFSEMMSNLYDLQIEEYFTKRLSMASRYKRTGKIMNIDITEKDG